jgi:hypothetical protein
MKAFNALYKYGYLYDKETNQRILLQEGSDLTITINTNDILTEDPYNLKEEILSEEQLLESLHRRKYHYPIKILPAGKRLFFKISAGIKSKFHEPIECLFELILLEDLYGGKKANNDKYNLMNCKTTVVRCISNNLEFFEPVHAYSLSDAYSKTYDFYFRLYGKPSGNVRTKMMTEPDGDPEFLKKFLELERDKEKRRKTISITL